MSSCLDAVEEEFVDGAQLVAKRKSSTSLEQHLELELPTIGKVKIHVQGDLEERNKKAVFLTVHDIGSDHSPFRDFVDHPAMSEVKCRSIFIHLDLPGQFQEAAELGETQEYPTIQRLGEELITGVLDHLKVGLVVGIGEGAGANILVRFAIKHTSRCLGLVLIHLVTAGVGMLEKLKESFFSGKRRPSEAFQAPEQVIALHKFGSAAPETGGSAVGQPQINSRLSNLNPKNVRKYVEAYMNRKDISDQLSSIKGLDCLLIAGSKSHYLQGVLTIYAKMNKEKTALLKVDNAIDVLTEAPEKVAQSLLLFVKGLGYLTSLTLPGVERQRTFSGESAGKPGEGGKDPKTLGAIGRRRTLSMEEYDLPRPRRLSLTTTGSPHK